MKTHYTVYGSHAELGAALGWFNSENEALAEARSGRSGDFGEGVYVCADEKATAAEPAKNLRFIRELAGRIAYAVGLVAITLVVWLITQQ